jgi:sortase A
MMNHSFIRYLVGGIFFLSLLLVLFSAVQIVSSTSKTDDILKEWESQHPIVAEPKINPAQPPKHDAEPADSVKESPVPPSKKKDDSLNGEVIGKLIIPALQVELPIVEGTEEEQLSKGVGHYVGSAYPGEPEHSVLAGHRDTVFRGLGKVKEGDSLIAETKAGRFHYRVYKQQIVDKDDRSVLVYMGEPVLTLVTCYPFNFVGNAPERYILSARLVQN